MIGINKEIKTEIVGNRTIAYAIIKAENGYCFYDKTDKNNRNYMTEITTSLVNDEDFSKQFEVIQGNVDELNAEVERLRENENNIPQSEEELNGNSNT